MLLKEDKEYLIKGFEHYKDLGITSSSDPEIKELIKMISVLMVIFMILLISYVV